MATCSFFFRKRWYYRSDIYPYSHFFYIFIVLFFSSFFCSSRKAVSTWSFVNGIHSISQVELSCCDPDFPIQNLQSVRMSMSHRFRLQMSPGLIQIYKQKEGNIKIKDGDMAQVGRWLAKSPTHVCFLLLAGRLDAQTRDLKRVATIGK